MELFQAGKKDLEDIVALAHALFEGNEMEALRAEMEALLHDADAAIFLCRLEGMAVGFAQCQLRRDYVEGAKSSPVGYLEGIYVKETGRGSRGPCSNAQKHGRRKRDAGNLRAIARWKTRKASAFTKTLVLRRPIGLFALSKGYDFGETGAA